MSVIDRVLSVSWILLLFCYVTSGQQESDCPGWTGEPIVPDEDFYNASNWVTNASAGSFCSVNVSDTCISLHWKLSAGNWQWVQCYIVLPETLSLTQYDLFGFDLHGSACDAGYPCHREQVVEVKFEDGLLQAAHTRMGEDGILCVDRWINKLFFHKYDNFFSIPEEFDWGHIQVISFGVKSHPWVDNPPSDSGIFSFRNLVADSTAGWVRPSELETLTVHADTLDRIKQDALDFILSRQTSTGLLTTWEEDGSSWLYGQGLALKVLTLEGEWDDNCNPVNEPAFAARNLARFLASHQQNTGYWPRAWNSYTGNIIVLYESDGSIWMGDFPWMLTGLYSYFKKSNDSAVLNSIIKGEEFLRSLIDSDGKFNTLHVPTGNHIPVTSSEAYAAAIGALLELCDTDLAEKLITYIHNLTWDTDLLYWREGIYSDRVVLFTNTWLALLLYDRGYLQESINALKLAGSLLYTCGPGEPCGLDGIGPIATWYEGTLSDIAAGGCGSNTLFNNIRPFINSDGSVPHYNDTIGGTAGIWAENWSSLDGTSWLYYVAAQASPFEVLNCVPIGSGENSVVIHPSAEIFPNPCSDYLDVVVSGVVTNKITFRITDLTGQTLSADVFDGSLLYNRIDVSDLVTGVYILRVENSEIICKTKFIKQ